MSAEGPGVAELINALREVKGRFDLESIRAVARVPGEHQIALTVTRGAPTTLEREDGHSVVIREP